MNAEDDGSSGALAAALANLEEATKRQDLAALLARDSEQLLCASPAIAPSDLWQEHSSDVWELARLRVRSERLAADNEQLRGQVLQLSARVDKLTSEAQAANSEAKAQRLVVHELAAERCAELEAALAQQRGADEALQAAAREAAAENCALRREAAALREGHALAVFKAKALQERAHTLEELYLTASRAAEPEQQPQPCAAALCSLQQIQAAELAAAPPTEAGGKHDAGLLDADPPQQLIPALQQMAALRRERDALAKQVGRGEERVRGLEGEREALLRAQAAQQRAQRGAADAGQARALGLARRVNHLAGQLKAKEAALGQKDAYIAKLELQLLRQQKALDAVMKPGKPALRIAAKPACAAQAKAAGLHRSSKGASKQPPKPVQAVAGEPGSHTLQPSAGAVEPRPPLAPQTLTEDLPTDAEARAMLRPGHTEEPCIAAADHSRQGAHQAAHASQPAGKAVRRALAPERGADLNGSACRTPAAPSEQSVPRLVPAATPMYVSASQQQQQLKAPGGMTTDSAGRASAGSSSPRQGKLACLQASPAVSEMVYELRMALQPGALPGPPGSVPPAPSARQRHGEAGCVLAGVDAAVGSSLSDAHWEQQRPLQAPGLPRATSDLVEFASRSGQASGAGGAVPEETSALPAYSGFSAEMRAAANAAAEVLLAEAASDSVSSRPRATSGSRTSASTRSSANFGAHQAAAPASTCSSAGSGSDQDVALASMCSSACSGADQAVATYSMDQPAGRGRGGSPEGGQELEGCGQAGEDSSARTSGSGECGFLPLEELQRRIEELHGGEEDGIGIALARLPHQHTSTDEQLQQHVEMSRGEQQQWVLAAGHRPEVSREEAEVDVAAHIRAVCAVSSVTFQDRGCMQGQGSQSVFAALAQQPPIAEKCHAIDIPLHMPGPAAERVNARQRLDFDAAQVSNFLSFP